MLSLFFNYVDELPPGSGFIMYHEGHLAWLAASAGLSLLLCLLYRKYGDRRRRRLELLVCWGAVSLDLLKYVYLGVLGKIGPDMLPLHLCGLAVYLSLFNALRPGKIKMEILYSLCMPGAAMALLFPAWTAFPMLSIVTLQNFLIHILLFAYPLMLVTSGRFTPDYKRLVWCLAFLLAVSPPIYLFNRAYGTNYMFLNIPSRGSPLELFASWWGNPGYLFGVLLMIIAVWVILYLPFALRQRSIVPEPGKGQEIPETEKDAAQMR